MRAAGTVGLNCESVRSIRRFRSSSCWISLSCRTSISAKASCAGRSDMGGSRGDVGWDLAVGSRLNCGSVVIGRLVGCRGRETSLPQAMAGTFSNPMVRPSTGEFARYFLQIPRQRSDNAEGI